VRMTISAEQVLGFDEDIETVLCDVEKVSAGAGGDSVLM